MNGRLGILIVFCASVLALPVSSGAAQATDDAFKKGIEKLLEVTGSSKMGVQMATIVSGQILDGLAKQNADIPPKAIELAKQVSRLPWTTGFAPKGSSSSAYLSSRWTVAGENAGRQTATYSAPPVSGVL